MGDWRVLTWADTHAQEENLQKSSLPERKFQHAVLEKKIAFGRSKGGSERNFPSSRPPLAPEETLPGSSIYPGVVVTSLRGKKDSSE